MTNTREKYAIIGAGPCGIAMARCLSKKNIDFQTFEYHSAVGGIWDNKNPLSTMYNSAHLISSKPMTQFDEFPMDDDVADFPHHSAIGKYFQKFADHFDLNKHIRFNSNITNVSRNEDGTWTLNYKDTKSGEEYTEVYKGVILSTGLFNLGNENTPKWEGQESFTGDIIHAANYKDNQTFADKRVLIVGCGNSAADISIDAVHRAAKVDMSVRRGYYFIPKYIFGKPMDQIKSPVKKLLPKSIARKIDKKIVTLFAGDPVRFGFPKPDYDFLESHPVINSYLLQYVGHGDIEIVGDIKNLNGSTVNFKDGTSRDYDVILTATGYHIKFSYIEHQLLNWQKNCPDLHLNIFHPEYDNLFVLGLIEATGIGWQGRYDQAELVSSYIAKKNEDAKSSEFQEFEQQRHENKTDLRNGMKYIKLDRMAYYVDKEHYMGIVKDGIEKLS
jgi:thioredoxin reductase